MDNGDHLSPFPLDLGGLFRAENTGSLVRVEQLRRTHARAEGQDHPFLRRLVDGVGLLPSICAG